MTEKKLDKNRDTAIQIAIIVILLVAVVLVNIPGLMKRKELANIYQSENEFVRTIDCAEIIDQNLGKSLRISFDAKAEIPGELLVYQKNSETSKYYFRTSITVTTDFEHYSVTVLPEVFDLKEKESFLAFYGTYGSGVIPTIKDITIEVIDD